jgi:hypothetical protein
MTKNLFFHKDSNSRSNKYRFIEFPIELSILKYENSGLWADNNYYRNTFQEANGTVFDETNELF